MFQRILMPTDGSPAADRAIEQGLELAKRLGSEVVFVHVLENPLSVGYTTPEVVAYSSQLYDDLKLAGQKVLAAATAKATSAGVPFTTKLVEDLDPVEAISQEEAECDLVVMGTHGRRGFNRWVFGSVAEGALRRSTKPFLLFRESDTKPVSR